VPAAAGVVHHVADDEPRWQVPATCPECGARVDQSTAAFAEHPACTYCAKPLPCQPAYGEDY
jgi:NAD-dependent DNA ligase